MNECSYQMQKANMNCRVLSICFYVFSQGDTGEPGAPGLKGNRVSVHKYHAK